LLWRKYSTAAIATLLAWMPVMRSQLSLSTSFLSFCRPTCGLISSSSRMTSILRPAIVPPICSKYRVMPFRFAFPSAANTFENEFSRPILSGAFDCASTAGARPTRLVAPSAVAPARKATTIGRLRRVRHGLLLGMGTAALGGAFGGSGRILGTPRPALQCTAGEQHLFQFPRESGLAGAHSLGQTTARGGACRWENGSRSRSCPSCRPARCVSARSGASRCAWSTRAGASARSRTPARHEEASLSEGYLEGGVVECPLHQATFDVRTGKSLTPPATEDLQVFDVEVDGDDIRVREP
jgi:hypothetical protein